MHWISTSDELVNRAIFESFPDPIAVVDGQLNLRFFNAPFAELVNEIGAVSLAVGMAPGDYLLERDRSLFERHLALALGGDPSVTRLTNPPVEELSSGREYHFVPVRTPDGEIDGVLISIRSSLRTCQKRMEEREEWHMAILETAAEGIVVSGEDGCIEVFNAAAERMFGYDRQEVLGHPLGVLMPPSLRERHDEHLRNYVASGEGCHVGVEKEVQGRRKDGSVFPMNIGLGQARIAGRYVFTAIVQDLTERKYFEERIRRAEKMEAVGLLAGGVAHDFNNLLTIVASYGHLIAEDLEEGSEHWDYLTRIRSAAERGARLTRQLLVFSASPDGEPRTIVINEIVVELEKLFHRVLEENVKLETVLAKDLHPIKVDPGHLEQLLMNLVINARDAMPRGGRIALRTFNVRVEEAGQDGVDPSERHSVSCRPRCFWSARAYGPYPVELSPGHHVVLEVKDDGQGMDGAVMSRIMEPFFTTKPSTRGTGLGLSTVYGIVQRYEGLIYVWSRPGEGSTFTVYFPAFLGEREEGKRA
ncbi:MAG: PAS domain S-box protein, partial [Bradymonadaceae bacterium]